MALSRAHSSANAANPAKLLLYNRRLQEHTQPSIAQYRAIST